MRLRKLYRSHSCFIDVAAYSKTFMASTCLSATWNCRGCNVFSKHARGIWFWDICPPTSFGYTSDRLPNSLDYVWLQLWFRTLGTIPSDLDRTPPIKTSSMVTSVIRFIQVLSFPTLKLSLHSVIFWCSCALMSCYVHVCIAVFVCSCMFITCFTIEYLGIVTSAVHFLSNRVFSQMPQPWQVPALSWCQLVINYRKNMVLLEQWYLCYKPVL